MNRKRSMSILAIIALSAIFISSIAFANPTLAQTQTSKSKVDNTSSSASKDYKDFQKCLSSAEDTKGYATKQEIKDCYNPIYSPTTSSATTTSDNVSPSGQ
jgi:peptidoglycan hydrolase CwlO-like protein